MRSAKRRRFERLEEAVARIPFRAELLQEWFEHFRVTGELPDDDDRLAHALLEQARRGGAARSQQMSRVELLMIGANPDGKAKADSVRDHLFAEAVSAEKFVRILARLAIEHLVLHGGDVCNAAFGADKGLPTYGTVGMHVMDVRRRLAVAPFEEQARRLFRRMDAMRGRVARIDDSWWVPIQAAKAAFVQHGEVPEDEAVRGWVLALVEYDCLFRHRRGQDVGELMAELDAVAAGAAEAREAALERVVEVARRCGVIRG